MDVALPAKETAEKIGLKTTMVGVFNPVLKRLCFTQGDDRSIVQDRLNTALNSNSDGGKKGARRQRFMRKMQHLLNHETDSVDRMKILGRTN